MQEILNEFILFWCPLGVKDQFPWNQTFFHGCGWRWDQRVVQVLYNKIGFFPLKYLRVPLHYTKLMREGIQPVIDGVIVGSLEGWICDFKNSST